VSNIREINIKPNSVSSGIIASLVKKHGTGFTVLRSANATDFIGSSFLGGANEFLFVQCKCCNPKFSTWISLHDFTILDEQETLF
jgi:hypothetical protein